MKRILLLITFVLFVSFAFAQITENSKAGKYPTIQQTNAAYGTKTRQDSIKNAMVNKADKDSLDLKLSITEAALTYGTKARQDSIKNALPGKADTTDVITPAQMEANSESLWDNVYSKTEVNQMSTYYDRVLHSVGVPYIAFTFGAMNPGVGAHQLTSGNLYRTPVWIDRDTTITSVTFTLSILGNYTPDTEAENSISLMKWNGTDYIEVATTPNTGDLWSNATANVPKTVNFDTPYVATRGLYHIDFLYKFVTTETTKPTILAGSNAGAPGNLFAFPSGLRLQSGKSGQTTIPSTDSPTSDYSSTFTPVFILK